MRLMVLLSDPPTRAPYPVQALQELVLLPNPWWQRWRQSHQCEVCQLRTDAQPPRAPHQHNGRLDGGHAQDNPALRHRLRPAQHASANANPTLAHPRNLAAAFATHELCPHDGTHWHASSNADVSSDDIHGKTDWNFPYRTHGTRPSSQQNYAILCPVSSASPLLTFRGAQW